MTARSASNIPERDIEELVGEVFYDKWESEFYGEYVESFLLQDEKYCLIANEGILEFGTGNGLSVSKALKRTHFTGRVRGYELDQAAFHQAKRTLEAENVTDVYEAEQGDFFSRAKVGKERCLIGNPPYLPSKTGDIRIRGLWGGQDGASCIRQLLNMNFDVVLLVISSISNPVDVIRHARRQGYTVADWRTRALVFGSYSCQLQVWQQIEELRAQHKAFYQDDQYLIAGVTWIREGLTDKPDLANTLETVLSSLQSLASIVHAV